MLYIHIPFCKSICSYCDFHHSASLLKRGEMVEAIIAEIKRRRDFINSPIRTIYFGGGTPSVLSAEEVSSIMGVIKRLWAMDLQEATLESNPEDISFEYLVELKKAGINRLSIGIQSFCDEHLAAFNRRHTARKAIESIEIARKAGFDNISIDLIYGMPFLSEQQWRENIKTAIKLGVEHISAYHLTIEPKTVLGKRKMQPVSDEVSQQHYDILCQALREDGFEHYEISNFAKPNKRAIHNSNYWNGTYYLGVGPSAHSFNGNIRHWNVASNKLYLEGDLGQSETLSKTDIYNERIMTSLRTIYGITGPSPDLLNKSRKLIKNGSLILSNDCLRIPENKWLISDYIISELFEI